MAVTEMQKSDFEEAIFVSRKITSIWTNKKMIFCNEIQGYLIALISI